MDNWQARFEFELTRGEAARDAGSEGMARVCARRAAGIVVDEYLIRQGVIAKPLGAYDSLRRLAALPGAPPEARQAAEHLLLRITPEHDLPVEADLLADARRLRLLLLG